MSSGSFAFLHAITGYTIYNTETQRGDALLRGLSPGNFQNYQKYSEHRTRLERAQRTAKELSSYLESVPSADSNSHDIGSFQSSFLDAAVQIGFESALDLPHKAIDYGITDDALKRTEKACRYCKHQYFVYGCEENCAQKNKGLPCKMEVKEYLD